MKLLLDGKKLELSAFVRVIEADNPSVIVSSEILSRIEAEHEIVLKYAQGDEPIYGLNTGLGANLSHRLKPDEVTEFQRQIVRGRAFAVGNPLSAPVVRGSLLARLVSATQGGSGMSPALFQTLIKWFESGANPTIPDLGSIGASDLTQNAHLGLCLIGEGSVETAEGRVDTGSFLSRSGITAHNPQPKDAMALINHSGLTVSLAAHALAEARQSFSAGRVAGLLSVVGYQANPGIFRREINHLRESVGQMDQARWFANSLEGVTYTPRRIQEALSFRLIAPVFGALNTALNNATKVWETELNGLSDSPAILKTGEMISTPNFASPALALALENLSLAFGQLATAANQRLQKLMNPELSGLPKYLSPVGGASAGFVPLQKTAASLLAEIQQLTQPITFNPPVVSDSVEDWAPMTPQAASKLRRQLGLFNRLVALEAIVACQAIDLRLPESSDEKLHNLHGSIRAFVPFRDSDTAVDVRDKTLRAIIEKLVEFDG